MPQFSLFQTDVSSIPLELNIPSHLWMQSEESCMELGVSYLLCPNLQQTGNHIL